MLQCRQGCIGPAAATPVVELTLAAATATCLTHASDLLVQLVADPLQSTYLSLSKGVAAGTLLSRLSVQLQTAPASAPELLLQVHRWAASMPARNRHHAGGDVSAGPIHWDACPSTPADQRNHRMITTRSAYAASLAAFVAYMGHALMLIVSCGLALQIPSTRTWAQLHGACCSCPSVCRAWQCMNPTRSVPTTKRHASASVTCQP
jgi:hypothetical protein